MNLFKIILFLSFTFQAVINACTLGEFQQVAGSPFAAGSGPITIEYSPITTAGNLFAATANNGSNNVSVYSVNQTTGAFTSVGAAVAAGTNPTGIAYSPIVSGNLFAAVSNGISDNVSVYTVNQTSGVFTPIQTIAAGVRAFDIAFSPLTTTGTLFAAVPNSGGNNISVYSVNTASGIFTAVPGSPFPNGTGPTTLEFSPIINGNLFAATSNFVSNTVSIFLVNQSTGALTLVGDFAAGAGTDGVAFSPIVCDSLLFLGAVNSTANTVSVYTVNPNTGALTQVAGSPFPTGTLPSDIDFSPLVAGGLFAGIVNIGSNNISVYNVCLVGSPIIVKALQIKNVFLTQIDLVNAIKLQLPSNSTAVNFLVFRDPALTNLAGTISASGCLRFFDHNQRPCVTTTYFIVAVDACGNRSAPLAVTITP
jgi:6-phosphogluconolactonase (cycloisomerase 2 family)